MIERIVSVFNLGATVWDKVKMASFYTFLFFSRRFGGKSSVKQPWHVCIRFEGKTYDFYLKYILDIHILREMFIDEQYHVSSDDTVKRVIDLGGNVGGSLVYMAHKFPMATIIVVEPHPACLEMLRLNAAQFGDRVQIVSAAACEKAGETLLYPNGEHWSASLSHRRGKEEGMCVPCVTFEGIANGFGKGDVDFVKCDIEGAEFEIFRLEDTLRIKRLIAEVHPSIVKKTVSEFVKLFPHHELVREEPVGDHIHVELKRKD